MTGAGFYPALSGRQGRAGRSGRPSRQTCPRTKTAAEERSDTEEARQAAAALVEGRPGTTLRVSPASRIRQRVHGGLVKDPGFTQGAGSAWKKRGPATSDPRRRERLLQGSVGPNGGDRGQGAVPDSPKQSAAQDGSLVSPTHKRSHFPVASALPFHAMRQANTQPRPLAHAQWPERGTLGSPCPFPT